MLNFITIGNGTVGKRRRNLLIKSGKFIDAGYYDPEYPDGLELNNLDNSIDCVFISTPNCFNKNYITHFLNMGKHVFCEKPPCLNLDELNEIEIAKKNNSSSVLMFGFNHRYYDSIIKIKSIISSGNCGKILWVRGRYGKGVDENFLTDWRMKKELSGGGILFDQGIHLLDLIHYLLGPYSVTYSEVSNIHFKADVEDNAIVVIQGTNRKFKGLVHSTMSNWKHVFSLEISTENCLITLNGLTTATMSYGEEILEITPNPYKKNNFKRVFEKYTVNNTWEKEHNEFYLSIIENRLPQNGNLKDVRFVMNLFENIYKNEK